MTLHIKNVWLYDQGQVDIQIDAGKIKAIAPNLPEIDGAESFDGNGMAAVSGLVNGHTHAAMSLFRGFGDDMQLMEWLQTRIWPAEAKLTEEDVYWGSRMACMEMIRSGTVAFEDMYWHFHGMAKAVEDSGLRAGVGAVMIDIAGEKQGQECRDQAVQYLEESGRYSDRVKFTLTPHAIYTVSAKSLSWSAEFSDKHNLPVHIHLSETAFEVSECIKQNGVRPAVYLDQQGLLTPRTILAHGVYLDDDELELIAKRGSTIVSNPVSNMKLAVGGVFPYQKAAELGIPIGLGSDGAASNNSLDMFQEVKTFSLIQKHANNDPTVLPSAKAWQVVTGVDAPLIGQGSGVLAAGENADILLLNRDEPEICPEHDFVSNLVYSATGHVVDTVIVAGKILMKNRVIDQELEIRQEATARAKSLCKV
ncbi:MAG: amidohydrolase [Magnetococcales bacterium]|nr:amidohydrolase [Magnetococcales bacterium]